MNKQQKSEIIDFLSAEFKASQAVVVCGYNGVSHKDLETLRVAAKEAGATVQVAKNSLVTVAVKNAELGDIELSGNNLFVWSEDQVTACKVADTFAATMKDKFEIKSGIIEGKIADLATVNQFAKLATRDELLGMLLSVWTAPARCLVTGLDNLMKKKEEEAA